MSRSEIFDEYAKLAEKLGIVSTAEESSPKKSSKKTREEISTIEALYGVKDKDDSDKHIMEQAHPNPCVIAPSYDKINGLVENEIERQNITINLIGAPPTGILGNKKLAQEQLTLALIRIANDMDNRGNDELRILADSCLEDLKKKVII
jgi:hypothetical protein